MSSDRSSPTYQNLFGSDSYYTVPPHRSVLSPAAYLVELLQLVQANITVKPSGYSLQTRRPDLWDIKFDKVNTDHEISKLEIVNQVLNSWLGANANNLSTAIYPFRLPYDHSLTQIRQYLAQNKTSLQEIWKNLTPKSQISSEECRSIDLETLGLSQEQWSQYSTKITAVTSLSPYYGFPSTTTAAELNKALCKVSTFLAHTGLNWDQLRDLVYEDLSEEEINVSNNNEQNHFYINQGSKTPPVAIEGENLINLSSSNLDRIMRFVRLAQAIGWTFTELDWALRTIGRIVNTSGTLKGQPVINDSVLKYLAWIQTQIKENKLSVNQACAALGSIKTFGKKNGPDFFSRIFNNKNNPAPPAWYGVNASILSLQIIKGIQYVSTSEGAYYRNNTSWLEITDFPKGVTVPCWGEFGVMAYAGTSQGLYKKLNPGSWQLVKSGIPADAYIQCLVEWGTSFYAGTFNGLYILTNSKWELVIEGFKPNTSIQCLVPIGTEMLYAATSNGLFCFNDNKKAWIEVKSPKNSEQVLNIQCISICDNSTYVGTSSGLFKVNGKNELVEVNNGIPAGASIHCLTPVNDNTLYTGTSKGLFYNSNLDWIEMRSEEDSDEILNIQCLGGDGRSAYAGTLNGLFGVNATAQLVAETNGIPNRVRVRCFSETNDSFYVGTSDGLYKKTEQNNWELETNWLPSEPDEKKIFGLYWTISQSGEQSPDQQIQTTLAAALQLSQDDLLAIGNIVLDYLKIGDNKLALTEQNLAILYRLSLLKQLTGFSIAQALIAWELLNAKTSSAKLPEGISSLERVSDFYHWLKASPFSLYQLQLILTGRSADPTIQNAVLGRDSITNFINGLDSSLIRSHLQNKEFSHRIGSQLRQLFSGLINSQSFLSQLTKSKESPQKQNPEIKKEALFFLNNILVHLGSMAEEVSQNVFKGLIPESIDKNGIVTKKTILTNSLQSIVEKAFKEVLLARWELFEKKHPKSNKSLNFQAIISQILFPSISTKPQSDLPGMAQAFIINIQSTLEHFYAVQQKTFIEHLAALYHISSKMGEVLKHWGDLHLQSFFYSNNASSNITGANLLSSLIHLKVGPSIDFINNPGTAYADANNITLILQNLQRTAHLITSLSLSPAEAAYFFNDHKPVISFPFPIDAIKKLWQFRLLVTNFGDSNNHLLNIIQSPASTIHPKALAKLSGWREEQIREVLSQLPDDAPNIGTVWLLYRYFGLKKLLGINISDLISLMVLSQGTVAFTEPDIANSLWTGLRSRFNSPWKALNKIENILNGSLRNALVNQALAQLNVNLIPYSDNPRGLYEYFLIDVSVSGVVQTTVIREAISAVQLYIYRVLNQLEHHTDLSEGSNLPTLWKWMKSYREWEANREVFLYPEDYIQPELRADKTALFAKAESDLNQAVLTDPDAVERVFKAYMNGLDEISRLQVISCAARDYDGVDGEGKVKFKELCMIGRTGSHTHHYYYRLTKFTCSAAEAQYTPFDWGQWQKITLPIHPVEYSNGKYGIAHTVFALGRWYVFWVTQRKSGQHTELQVGKGSGNAQGVQSKKIESYLASLHFTYLDYNHNWVASETLFSLDLNDKKIRKNNQGEVRLYYNKPFKILYLSIDNIQLKYDPDVLPSVVIPPINELNDTINCLLTMDGVNYAATNGGLYFEKNGNWKAVPGTSNWDVVTLKTMDGVNYAGTESGLYFEKNGNWEAVPEMSSLNVNTLQTMSGVNYAGTQSGLYFLYNGKWGKKANFPTISTPIPNIPISTVYDVTSKTTIPIQNQANWSIINHQTAQYLNVPYENNHSTCINVYRLNSNAIPKIGELLNGPNGVINLLSIPTQKTKESPFSQLYPVEQYIPQSNWPSDQIGFTEKDAMREYFWEIFFHLPFLIAKSLKDQHINSHARKWYEYIFNPVIRDSSKKGIDKYWRFLGLRSDHNATLKKELGEKEPTELLNDLNNPLQLYTSNAEPFDPQAIARLRPIAYQKTTVTHYIENLLSWGDQLYRKNTRDSINEAEMLYVEAYNLLGEQPKDLGPEPLWKVGTWKISKDNNGTRIYVLKEIQGKLYAGTKNRAYVLNNNGGWENFSTGLQKANPNSPLYVRGFCYFKGQFFLGTWGGTPSLYYLEDGKTWQKEDLSTSTNPTSDITSISIFNGLMYIIGDTPGIVTYDGISYTEMSSTKNLNIRSICLFGGAFYVGTHKNGVYKLVGNKPQPLNSGISTTDTVHSLCVHQKSLFAGTSNGLYKLIEDTWMLCDKGIPEGVEVYCLYVFEAILYAGTNSSGLYALRGNRMVQQSNGLPNNSQISFLESFNRALFAGMMDGTIWELPPAFGIPRNQQFLNYWIEVQSRLYNINHGLTIDGQPDTLPLFSPPINPMQLVSAIGSGEGIGTAVGTLNSTVPYYRFEVMIAKAKEVTDSVIQLGQSLMSALESKDAQKLAELYNTHQQHILNLTQTSKQDQIEAAKHNLFALHAGLTSANNRQTHYSNLITAKLIPKEKSEINHSNNAIGVQDVVQGIKLIVGIGYLIPVIFGFSDGNVNLGASTDQGSAIAENMSNISNMRAGLMGIHSGFHRRRQDWQLQQKLASDDILQIQHQIKAATHQQNLAEQGLVLLKENMVQTKKITQYYLDRFTNQQLYSWYIGQVSGLFYQGYQLAHDLAVQAENAWKFEHIGLKSQGTALNFIQGSYWNDLYKGLTSGLALQLDLQRMEKAYTDENLRRLEIKKTISLALLDPKALLDLIQSGSCQFNLTEKDFAFDFPGHFCRKIKSISLSIPMILGPYQNIHATLIQLSNKLVASDDEEGINTAKYLLGAQGGQQTSALHQDLVPNQQVALTTGMNDSGLFELNFHDPRYLPFEGTGAVSSWMLDLPIEENSIDYDSITDVIIQLDYTALPANNSYTQAVRTARGPFTGVIAISLSQEFPNAWHRFAGENSKPLVFSVDPSNWRGVKQQGAVTLDELWIWAEGSIPQTTIQLTDQQDSKLNVDFTNVEPEQMVKGTIAPATLKQLPASSQTFMITATQPPDSMDPVEITAGPDLSDLKNLILVIAYTAGKPTEG